MKTLMYLLYILATLVVLTAIVEHIIWLAILVIAAVIIVHNMPDPPQRNDDYR